MTSSGGAAHDPAAVPRSASRTWATPRPVDLALTLRPLSRGRFDPTMRWVGSGVWRTLRTVDGTATLHLEVDRGAGAVRASAWGAGCDAALDLVPGMVGEGDDDDGFDVSAHPFLHDARRRSPGLRLVRVGLVFEMLVPAILEQKVTTVEARRAWRTLVAQHGEAAPGPAPEEMRVAPSPRAWSLIPSWDWHRAGVDPRRSRTVLAAASVAPGLERTLALGRGGEEIARKIRSVPGVGVWTAAETTQRSHGDPDAVSVGDYHLPALVGWALVGEPVDDDGMLELLEPWRGHRQRVMRLIESSGFAKPKFGPRMTIQDHRAH
ncbi:DNA-3-methyladenine glycosylase family protein [Marisediminicola sp. LYQ85]|uniref:DNA-3-methyladenine glycosylase family protein n=1 Tax=Marisediminicola sp. LYQ85 TaxID=3391062 RepID=UPI003983AB5F